MTIGTGERILHSVYLNPGVKGSLQISRMLNQDTEQTTTLSLSVFFGIGPYLMVRDENGVPPEDESDGFRIPALIWFGVPSLLVSLGVIVASLLVELPLWAGLVVGFVTLNLVTLYLYRRDKAISKINDDLPEPEELPRVPVALLLGLVLVGGTLGGLLGMYGSDEGHKTGKEEHSMARSRTEN